jgi:hypothetical protein
MRIIRASIAAYVLVTSACASTAVPLDRLLAFDDPYLCHPSKHLDALLNGVIRWEQLSEPTPSNDIYKGTLLSPPIPAKFRKQVGKPHLVVEGKEYRASVPLNGTWQGLPLHSLVVVQRVESEGGFYLMFDATRDQVLDAANKAGFRIPASGSDHREGEVMDLGVGVETYRGKSAIYCFDN